MTLQHILVGHCIVPILTNVDVAAKVDFIHAMILSCLVKCGVLPWKVRRIVYQPGKV
jgi:hypothetical protein